MIAKQQHVGLEGRKPERLRALQLLGTVCMNPGSVAWGLGPGAWGMGYGADP